MRLIDADALLDDCVFSSKQFEKTMREFIGDAPTIEPEQKKNEWIPCSERLPEDSEPVNITWVNHNPVSYYADIKDKPFTATGHYCNGKWWWFSAMCQDYLDEYGRSDNDDMSNDIEVTAWMPLPNPWEGEE